MSDDDQTHRVGDVPLGRQPLSDLGMMEVIDSKVGEAIAHLRREINGSLHRIETEQKEQAKRLDHHSGCFTAIEDEIKLFHPARIAVKRAAEVLKWATGVLATVVSAVLLNGLVS